MMLLTKELLKKLPKLGETEGQGGEALAVVKFFHPCSNWTWYATEYDGTDIFFGLVDGFEKEYGNFSLSELENAPKIFGLGIERDRGWKPKKLKELHDIWARS